MISLYLMGEKGLSVLSRLHDEDLTDLIDAVVGAKDTNVENDYYDEIRILCMKLHLRFYDRHDNLCIVSKYSIAVAWRWLINNGNSKLIVLHDSLLPKYRGFAPLVNMLIHQEPFIGVTALFATKECDKGDIIEQKMCKVNYPIKIHNAIKDISPLYSGIVCNLVKKIKSNIELTAYPQNENEATYSLWRDEDDYLIDWNDSSSNIQQFVYSVGFPYKGASSYCNGTMVRILDCILMNDVVFVNRQVGKVAFIDNGMPVIVCGSGLLKITKLISEDGLSLLPFNKLRSRFA